MPVKVHWPTIRMLFATGKTFEEIAAATGILRGTISARCTREKWIEDRKQVQLVVADATKQTAAVLIDMKSRGVEWTHRVAGLTDKAIAVLEREEPTNLLQVDRFVSVIDKTDKVARRNYGMDSENAAAQTIVNLGVLQDYTDRPIKAAIVAEEPNESKDAIATV